MPTYISESMLEARTGESMLARFVNQPASSAAYTAAVLDVMERADDQVNAYLSNRFAVPVTSTGLLEECALSIAEWELYRRGQGNVPEKVKLSYDHAVEILESIRDGEMGTGGTAAPASAGVAGLETDGAAGLFDADSMEDAHW